MASLDEFFERAIKIAQDINKSRTARKQKQQEIDNLATFSTLNTQDRRTRTDEGRAATEADLGQQSIDLERASLAVRKQLGLGQLKVGGRQAGVQEGALGLDRDKFNRSSALFKSLFPESSGGGPSQNQQFINQADQNVLQNSKGLVNRGKGNIVSNSQRRSDEFRKSTISNKNRGAIKSTLENDLLSLR